MTDGAPTLGGAPTGGNRSGGAAPSGTTSDGAAPSGAASGGAAPSGTASNSAAHSGATSDGAASNTATSGSAASNTATSDGAAPRGATSGSAAPRGAAPAPLPTIRVAALALIRERRVLMVTARARDVYYMPGGKIDPGETAAEAAVREAFEEVSVRVDPATVHQLFTVTVQAHGEPEGRLVQMQVFSGSTPDAPTPSSEVDAVHWVAAADEHRCPPAGAETLRRLQMLGLID